VRVYKLYLLTYLLTSEWEDEAPRNFF